jgi:hypothetical protein
MLTDAEIKKEQGLQNAGLRGLASGIEKSGNKIKAEPMLREVLKNMADSSSNEIKAAVEEINKWLQ